MYMEIPDELAGDYAEAEAGRKIILDLKQISDSRDGSACWIIFPSDDEELNRTALEILPSFMNEKFYRKAVLISVCSLTEGSDRLTADPNRKIYFRRIGEKDMSAVLRYYRLVQFASDIIVISLDEPYAFSKWIGHFGITRKDIVRDGLFFGQQNNWLWWFFDREEISRAVRENTAKLKDRKVYLYGLTRYAGAIISALRENETEPECILDSDPQKSGRSIDFGSRVELPEKALCPYQADAVIITVKKYSREMRARLSFLGYHDDQIIEIPISSGIHTVRNCDRETMDTEFRKVIDGWNLRKSFGSKRLILSQSGTGDVYFTCILLPGYLEDQGLQDYTFLTLSSSSCVKVAHLFGIKDVRTVSLPEASLLFKAWDLLGGDRLNMKPALNLGSRLPKKYLPRDPEVRNAPWRHWANCMRYQYFWYEKFSGLKFPEWKDLPEWKARYEEMGLQPGKTVVLSPYANSYNSMLREKSRFWERLAEELHRRGYSAVTNCFENEAPVPGTVPFCVPYEELFCFLNYSGWLIAVKSGLCELASSVESCRMLVIFEKGSGASSYMWSLKRMGLHPNGEDYSYDGDPELLLSQILKEFPDP